MHRAALFLTLLTALTGRLTARTTAEVRIGRRSRTVTLTPKSFTVAAGRSARISFALPASLRSVLGSKGRLGLRVTATVRGPGQTARPPVRTTLTPRLKR